MRRVCSICLGEKTLIVKGIPGACIQCGGSGEEDDGQGERKPGRSVKTYMVTEAKIKWLRKFFKDSGIRKAHYREREVRA